MRRLAALGMGLTVVMQFIFFTTSFERGPLYMMLQAFAMTASITAAWGILRLPHRDGLLALAIGLGWNALNRPLHMVLDLTRLSPWLNWALFAGYAFGCAFAIMWAVNPHRGPRAVSGVRFACWWLAVTYFLSAGTALSSGRLSALFALTLGAVGFSLVAPNLHAAPLNGPATT